MILFAIGAVVLIIGCVIIITRGGDSVKFGVSGFGINVNIERRKNKANCEHADVDRLEPSHEHKENP